MVNYFSALEYFDSYGMPINFQNTANSVNVTTMHGNLDSSMSKRCVCTPESNLLRLQFAYSQSRTLSYIITNLNYDTIVCKRYFDSAHEGDCCVQNGFIKMFHECT